jgi:hypothetical protein
MEACETEPVRGQAHSVQAVIDALLRHGVEITDEGSVRLVAKPRR